MTVKYFSTAINKSLSNRNKINKNILSFSNIACLIELIWNSISCIIFQKCAIPELLLVLDLKICEVGLLDVLVWVTPNEEHDQNTYLKRFVLLLLYYVSWYISTIKFLCVTITPCFISCWNVKKYFTWYIWTVRCPCLNSAPFSILFAC